MFFCFFLPLHEASVNFALIVVMSIYFLFGNVFAPVDNQSNIHSKHSVSEKTFMSLFQRFGSWLVSLVLL